MHEATCNFGFDNNDLDYDSNNEVEMDHQRINRIVCRNYLDKSKAKQHSTLHCNMHEQTLHFIEIICDVILHNHARPSPMGRGGDFRAS
uniref:Uncharacterized protein n=1 Tax=Vespula pensylvanica TaxID=30213 RepID=A0A834N0V5_VESPE|nr:hypothetical protein H0235_017311 [Vespula pensylvanica]